MDQPDSAIVMKLAGASLGKFHANNAEPVIQMLELLNTLLGGKAVASDTPIPDAVAPQSE